MVTGLVYTQVDRSRDHRNEVLRVKQSLVRGAQSIRKMRGRNSAHPRTAYANKPGRSLLRSTKRMENQILALQKKTEDYEEKIQVVTHEVTILRPLKRTAIDIRQRFFATNRRRQDALRMDDPDIIESGNLRAHAGDVILDVCLFKDHLIVFEETFSDLYGVSWPQAEQLLGSEQLVEAMNARATGITNPRLGWSSEQEAEFRNFVNAGI